MTSYTINTVAGPSETVEAVGYEATSHWVNFYGTGEPKQKVASYPAASIVSIRAEEPTTVTEQPRRSNGAEAKPVGSIQVYLTTTPPNAAEVEDYLAKDAALYWARLA